MKTDPLPNKTLDNIRTHLKTLKLGRMDDILEQELSRAATKSLSPAVVVERLLAAQAQFTIQNRIERRIKESKLPQRKLLADFDFDFQKGLDKAQIMQLADLSFVKRKQGLILAGGSGVGKSHIAQALLLMGCQKLYRARYTTAADMLKELLAGLSDDTLEQKLKKYTRPDILLIDEIGFDRLEQESARNASLFFKVIDGRYCTHSTMMTTNIDFKQLGDYLGDPVITTAIVDRMVHHSIIINIDGPSYRMKESKNINRKTKSKSK